MLLLVRRIASSAPTASATSASRNSLTCLMLAPIDVVNCWAAPGSIWCRSLMTKDARVWLATALLHRILDPRPVLGAHVQRLVHPGHVPQIKRAVDQALVAANPFECWAHDPVLVIVHFDESDSDG